MLREGLSHTSRLMVCNDNSAITLGSGDMSVLGTPAMLAVAEELDEGTTTVGGHIESSHLKPSKIGAEVEATATVTRIDGKKLYFSVVAREGTTVIGEGTHLRFIVDRERFLSKVIGH